MLNFRFLSLKIFVVGMFALETWSREGTTFFRGLCGDVKVTGERVSYFVLLSAAHGVLFHRSGLPF